VAVQTTDAGLTSLTVDDVASTLLWQGGLVVTEWPGSCSLLNERRMSGLSLVRVEFVLVSLGIPLAVVVFAILLRYQRGETYTSGADLLLAGAILDFSAIAAHAQLLSILSSPFKELAVPLFVLSGIMKLCYFLDCVKVERRLTLNFLRRLLLHSQSLSLAPSEVRGARFPLFGLLRTWFVSSSLVAFDVYIITFRGAA
jgi:hypothetical protein